MYSPLGEGPGGFTARKATTDHVYDAIAPIVSADSLDYSRLFKASRYGKGG